MVVVVSDAQPEKATQPTIKRQRVRYRFFITGNTRSPGNSVAIPADSWRIRGILIRQSDEKAKVGNVAAFADRPKLADRVVHMKTNLIALTLLALVGIFLAGCAATTETTTTTRTREESSMYAR